MADLDSHANSSQAAFADMVGRAWRVADVYRVAPHRAMPVTVVVERSDEARADWGRF